MCTAPSLEQLHSLRGIKLRKEFRYFICVMITGLLAVAAFAFCVLSAQYSFIPSQMQSLVYYTTLGFSILLLPVTGVLIWKCQTYRDEAYLVDLEIQRRTPGLG